MYVLSLQQKFSIMSIVKRFINAFRRKWDPKFKASGTPDLPANFKTFLCTPSSKPLETTMVFNAHASYYRPIRSWSWLVELDNTPTQTPDSNPYSVSPTMTSSRGSCTTTGKPPLKSRPSYQPNALTSTCTDKAASCTTGHVLTTARGGPVLQEPATTSWPPKASTSTSQSWTDGPH